MTDSITEAATRRLPPPGRLVRLWPRVRPYRWQLVLASVALVASGLLALAFPMAVRYLLDAAFVERDRAMLDRIAIGLVVIFTVQSALNYFQAYLLSAVGERFDPQRHEAVSRAERSDVPDQTVVAETLRGYVFQDRVLRPAQVVVAVPRAAAAGDLS